MSLSYAQLETRIASYLKRDDLASDIPSLITAAENELNRRLAIVQMESVTSFTLSAATDTKAFSDIGAGVIAVLKLWKTVNNSVDEVSYRDPEQFIEVWQPSTQTGQPYFWTVQGGTVVQFDEAADQDYPLYARVRSKFDIVNDAPTNYLALNHEDIYLYASLAAAAPFIKDDKRIPQWRGLLDVMIGQLEEMDQAARASREAMLVPGVAGYVGLQRPFNIYRG